MPRCRNGFATTFGRAIYAGFIIATMIRLLPAADSARFWIILVLAWLVGVAGLTHIVAGSAETLCVVFTGQRSIGEWITGFFVPAFLGNSIGVSRSSPRSRTFSTHPKSRDELRRG